MAHRSTVVWSTIPHLNCKNIDAIRQLVPKWNATELVMRDVNEWIIEHAGPTIDAITCLKTIQETKVDKLPSHGS